MIGTDAATEFPELNMKCLTTYHEHAGESLKYELNAPPTPETYLRRHVCVSGSVSITSDTDPEYIGRIGDVWLIDRSYTSSSLLATSLEDNFAFLCAIPFAGYKVRETIYNLSDGESVPVEVGAMVVLIGKARLSEDMVFTNGKLALRNNSATFTAIGELRLIELRAYPL